MDAVEEKKDAIQDGDYAIGCVMCATNFAWNDEQTIVTTCGHLYHQNCLEKWFQSLDVINPGVYKTCPDCRTKLGEADIKPVFMHFTSPDDMQSHLLEKIKRQLTQCENDLEMAQRQLKSEKAKNKRLTTKYNALEKKFETAAQMECTGCGLTSPARWKITRKKTTTVVTTTVQAASGGTQKSTKKLRSREYTYSL